MYTSYSPGIPQAPRCQSHLGDEVLVLQTMIGALARLLLALLGSNHLGDMQLGPAEGGWVRLYYATKNLLSRYKLCTPGPLGWSDELSRLYSNLRRLNY